MTIHDVRNYGSVRKREVEKTRTLFEWINRTIAKSISCRIDPKKLFSPHPPAVCCSLCRLVLCVEILRTVWFVHRTSEHKDIKRPRSRESFKPFFFFKEDADNRNHHVLATLCETKMRQTTSKWIQYLSMKEHDRDKKLFLKNISPAALFFLSIIVLNLEIEIWSGCSGPLS